MDHDAYCREVEAYLCRRNAGHLIRVVGPSFTLVVGWAAQGVPLKVVFRGIDRVVERRAAKGPSRRPLRIEFCEADVLDVFDEWRRAVGVGGAAGSGAGAAPAARATRSLRGHLDRVVVRLTDRLAAGAPAALEPAIERLLARLDESREPSRTLRGEARAALVAQLQRWDDELMEAALGVTPAETVDALRQEATEELAGFLGRMPREAYERALRAATARLLRDRLTLPDITYAP
jgi:hypothetical protein